MRLPLPPLHVETRTGAAIVPHVAELAALRIGVFSEWPYLYDGDEAYERAYLMKFSRSAGAMLALAFHEARIIGAATCMPLADAASEISAPVGAAGLSAVKICYFGESVLLPPFRGRGFGVAFFAAREAQARRLGLDWALFYAVRRAADDARRPAGAASLDSFWRHRGFAPLPGVSARMKWREHGATDETENLLDAWSKPLQTAAP